VAPWLFSAKNNIEIILKPILIENIDLSEDNKEQDGDYFADMDYSVTNAPSDHLFRLQLAFHDTII